MEDRPQGVLNKQILQTADLLVAIFWTRLGTPTGEADSGTAEEIEKHVAAGKPAMIYFSSAPVRPESVDAAQYQALSAFRKEIEAKGLIDTFESLSDFRSKLARNIAAAVNGNAYFEVGDGNGNVALPILPDRNVPSLSSEARTLLLAAVEDREGIIQHAKYIGGSDVQTNGRQFIEQDNARSRAAWEGAIDELVTHDLIRDLGFKGEVFQVTRQGYDLADVLKGT
jgi:hypothetical protein